MDVKDISSKPNNYISSLRKTEKMTTGEQSSLIIVTHTRSGRDPYYSDTVLRLIGIPSQMRFSLLKVQHKHVC